MSPRKELKKTISKLKQFRNNLPMLIDCSENVYGDEFYSQTDLEEVDKKIKELEENLEKDLEV